MTKFCPKPFEYLSVHGDGSAWVCCEDWLDQSIGNVLEQGVEATWRSSTAETIRQSILDGSFSYCSKERCPALVGGDLPDAGESALHASIAGGTWTAAVPPTQLSLTYDPTCNLKCPSCRSRVIGLSRDERRQASRLQAELLEYALPGASDLVLSGYGDPFASALLRSLLRSLSPEQHSQLSVRIMTNGLLLDAEAWRSLGSSASLISSVHVSIDACSTATYSLNRGGDYSRLLRNLGFVAALRAKAEIDQFEISFVVQANNFSEMVAFVELGEKLGCDEVLFQDLVNWGTYTEEEFRGRAVSDPEHVEHSAFLEVLQAQKLRSPIVNLSNLKALRDAVV